jgi:leucyl aminopeptidase
MPVESRGLMSKIALPLALFTSSHVRFDPKVKKTLSPAQVFVLGEWNEARIQDLVRQFSSPWQHQALLKKTKEMTHFSGPLGPVWILARKSPPAEASVTADSNYAWYREQVGSLLGYFRSYDLYQVSFELIKTNKEQERAILVGLNLSAYSYKSVGSREPYQDFPKVVISKRMADSERVEAEATSLAVNCARHLVNTPPNLLNPATFSQTAQKYFSGKRGVKLEIWNEARLQKEKMGLHLGVGRGSNTPPCLVHISYRPGKPSKKKPIAIVGKGITFDSGGLDIKPSSGMRLMKKDMGGAAATLGLAMWAEATKYPRGLDFYLALAENSVDGNSMRPSDVLTARNGMQVEIHNTDAEGRLVLADALDVAVTRAAKDEPEMVLNFATLTGACRVALGAEIAGLFSNNDKLAEELHRAGLQAGDLNWRMPLFPRYTSGFSSQFADVVNATDGFGGAITAALFLEKFVREKPWAHLDTYAWADKGGGAITAGGGNGQPIQAVVEFLKKKK